MIYLSNEPYPQEISVPRSFGVIVPHRNEYLSTADIATDLTTDSDQKVLAASQGVVLKEMVEAKADASDVYTKQEVDADLALKADKADTYTKAQVDGALAGKQDVITDLATIRSGAAAGATAVQPAELSAGLATKQDTINDLATIRSGAAAGATAVQPSQMQAALAGKQDVLTFDTTPTQGSTNPVSSGGVKAALDGKQDTLESGVNIKTINNQSLLGSGNIDIQRGGGTIDNEVTKDSANAVKSSGIYAALGKYGVISQTQTWTGSDAEGYNYTMSDQVYGMIPRANIDLYENAGAVFNETTGYFELNGLTDISYQEMQTIYSQTIGVVPLVMNRGLNLTGTNARTNFPMAATTSYGITLNYLAYANGKIEVVAFKSNIQINSILSAPFHSCRRLKKIIGVIILAVASGAHSSAFSNCASLESITLKGIKIGIPFPVSPRLSLESVVYMVENATNTTAITITLHATAYARCQADTTEYTYQGNTYTGIIAYANARNITIASA